MTGKERSIRSPAQIPKTVSFHSVLRYLFVLLLFCAGLLFTLAFHAASAEADTGNNAASDLESLVFLGNHRLPPMNYLENDQAKGLVVEIVEAMAARMERPVTIKLMDWAEAQELVLAGEADALIQINATEERELLYEFSEPLLESEFAIFIPADKPGIGCILDLKGLTVAAETKGYANIVLQRDPLISIIEIPDLHSGFKLLLEGSVDAVVGDRWVGAFTLAENNIKGVAVAEQPIDIQYSSIAVKKGNTLLLAEINRALGEIKEDGTYQRIIDKWQAKEVVFQTVEQVRQQRLIIAGSLAALFIVLVFALVLLYLFKKSRQTEQALRESEKKYLSLFEQSVLGIYLHDFEGKIVDLNYKGCAQLGYAKDELLEMSVFDLHPQDENTINMPKEDTLKSWSKWLPGDQHVLEAQHQRKDGSVFPVQITVGIVQYDSRKMLLAMIQDISERKQAEEEIRTLNAELEQRVTERTIELEAVNEELASFTYSVSHDLRAPLRALDGYSASLTEKYNAQLDDQGRHYLNRIRKTAIYMSDLVDNLLKLSRITRTELKEQEVDLSQVAEEIFRDLQDTEPERQVKVKVAPGLLAKGDFILLKAALENLIGNAWKFSSKEEQATIEVGRTTIDGEEAFFVRDNGVGFDLAYAKNLFGAFQRLHGVNEFPGTGIGLATVQRIVTRHGGQIWAESEVGKGATFYFTLKN